MNERDDRVKERAEVSKPNLEALLDTYCDDESRKTIGLLLALPDSMKNDILRSHFSSEIGGHEIFLRDAIDDLLEVSGWIELACASGYIDLEIVAGEDIDLIHQALTDPFVRRFYELFYPQLLPTLLRRRLTGSPLEYGDSESSREAFPRALQLDATIQSGEAKGFLRLLDDFQLKSPDGKSFGRRELLSVLSDPNRFVSTLLDQSAQEGERRASLGLLKFLEFVMEIHRLLEGLRGASMLQSAFWHQYGYWFRLLFSQTGGMIATALDRLAEGVGPSHLAAGSERAVSRTLTDIARAQNSIRVLTSSYYSYDLEKACLDEFTEAETTELLNQLRTKRIEGGAAKRAAEVRGDADGISAWNEVTPKSAELLGFLQSKSRSQSE